MNTCINTVPPETLVVNAALLIFQLNDLLAEVVEEISDVVLPEHKVFDYDELSWNLCYVHCS